jgi:hypothetical protein
VLDLVTGEVAEAAPGADGVTLAGRTIRVAADPTGRLRVSAATGELGSVACAVGEGTRLVAASSEALLVVSDVDARVPTTVWTARGAALHEALGRPLLDATPEHLAVLDVTATGDLSDTARRCLALFREVLALRLRDAVEITVETAVVGGTGPGAGSTGTATSGPGPRDVEIDLPGPDPETPHTGVPAYLSSMRTGWRSR